MFCQPLLSTTGLGLYDLYHNFYTSSVSMFTLSVCLLPVWQVGHKRVCVWQQLLCTTLMKHTPPNSSWSKIEEHALHQKHTNTHTLRPLAFDTHSLHTLPSNAADSSLLSLQGRAKDREGETISDDDDQRVLELQERYLIRFNEIFILQV